MTQEHRRLYVDFHADEEGFWAQLHFDGEGEDEDGPIFNRQELLALGIGLLHGAGSMVSKMGEDEKFSEMVAVDWELASNVLAACNSSVRTELRSQGHLSCSCDSEQPDTTTSEIRFSTIGFEPGQQN